MSVANKYMLLYSVTGEFHSLERQAAPKNGQRAASKKLELYDLITHINT